MTRLRRLLVTDRIFFVTSNLLHGHSPLWDREFDLLIDVFKAVRQQLGFALCGYVFMPDHWHALIWPQFPLTISRVLKEIKEVSTDLLNQQRRVEGNIWQPRFWDRFVRNKKEFNERLEYMHLNPVRKGWVVRPQDWRWSSHNNFSLDPLIVGACPIQVDYIHLSDDYRG
ncbi:MAG: REP-associated tyrosine transposase [Terriglobia bacterium]